jgi:hypothetical protein
MRKIIKIRAQIYGIETKKRKKIQRINQKNEVSRRVPESGRVARECKHRDSCEEPRTKDCRPWLLEELQGKKLNNHFVPFSWLGSVTLCSWLGSLTL